MTTTRALQLAAGVISGVHSFAAEMKAQGIHVGLGSPPHCVVDGETWPCSYEQAPKHDDVPSP